MPPTDFEMFVSEFDKRDDCVDVTFCDGTVETYDMLIGADGQEKEADDSTNMGIYMCFSKTLRIPNTNKLFALYIATGQQMLMTHIHSDTKDQVHMGVRDPREGAGQSFCGRLFQNAGLRAEELVESMHKAIDFFASSILPSYGPEQLPKAFEAYEKRFRRTWISCRMFRKW
ncbi:hypothetical protein ARSEF1564_009021 [Beauveria bassiana]